MNFNKVKNISIPDGNVLSISIGNQIIWFSKKPGTAILYEDGSTTAPAYGSYYCQGNCAHCHYNEEGCFRLKEGESVIFPAH